MYQCCRPHYLIALPGYHQAIDRHGLSTCNRACRAPYLDAKLCVEQYIKGCPSVVVVVAVFAAPLRTGVDCLGEALLANLLPVVVVVRRFD